MINNDLQQRLKVLLEETVQAEQIGRIFFISEQTYPHSSMQNTVASVFLRQVLNGISQANPGSPGFHYQYSDGRSIYRKWDYILEKANSIYESLRH